MSDNAIPAAIATDVLDVLGQKVTVHVLDNGQRVIEHADMMRLLTEMAGYTDLDLCEGCSKPLASGDLAHRCPEGPIFCEACAPTWADIRREYDEAKADGSFEDMFFDPEDAAVSDRVVDERMAAGDGDKKHVWPL